MAIPYVKQSWVDGSGGGTPLSAARMGVLEQAAFDAHYMPAVHVTHNATQSLTTAVSTALAFNTERFDTASNTADTMHDTVTNNSRLTCRYAGIYLIGANVEFAANATGQRQIAARFNGTGVELAGPLVDAAAGALPTKLNLSTCVQLAVNDYIELMAFQNSGGALNVAVQTNWSPEFWMVRVG